MKINGIGNDILTQTISNTLGTAQTKASSVQSDEFKKILETAKAKGDEKQLRKACEQFEEMFLRLMMKNMRQTVKSSGIEENSFARETYQEMLDNELAKECAKGEGIGISSLMYDQLKKSI